MTASRADLIRLYEETVLSMDHAAQVAHKAGGRATGGYLRATKGTLVETIAKHAVKIAWAEVDGSSDRLSFDSKKTFRVAIRPKYVAALPDDIREYIEASIEQHFYRAKIDVKGFVDGELVLAVECKSYAENAMLKRILVDFSLLKTLYPNLVCCLLQLESQLGGSYSEPFADPQYGSPSTHTLMSYFPEVSLNIITLLKGERHPKRPIHNPEYYKELRPEYLDHAIKQLRDLLVSFV